jgi:hypothetical protein
MKRWIAALLGLFHAANGFVMLFVSSAWFKGVPGVSDTGPFNPHFVQDVGIAFIAAGLALGARAWWPAFWPAAHAVLHLIMIASGHDHYAGADLAAVVLPAALALYSAFPGETERLT